MALLLSLMPPLAWGLLFLVLVSSASYLYVNNKNWGKVAISNIFIIVLIVGWSWGHKLASNDSKMPITKHQAK